MQSALYVALSAQVALERRLNTVANNVANMNTAGFRAEEVKFDTVLSRTAQEAVAFSSTGDSYTSRRTGPVEKTNNPLDVAVEGDTWLAIDTPAGIVYTRDGRMRMAEGGELQTLTGNAILDNGGSHILLDPDAGPPTITRDGTITQGGNVVGTIGLFEIPETSRLTRYDNSGVIPDTPAVAVQDFTANGVVQGSAEGANVNPLMEMTKLITIQRTFEDAASMIKESESSLQDAIRDLGPSS